VKRGLGCEVRLCFAGVFCKVDREEKNRVKKGGVSEYQSRDVGTYRATDT
jgi:hypothetical protein